MTELEDQLKSLIAQFGATEVRKHVAKLTGTPKRSVRKAATEYVAEMSVPATHKERLLALARLFEQGRFLPNTADIRNLFHEFGASSGTIKARQAAVPMIFRLLASCPTDRLDKVLSQGLFSGPAELAPIAEAIKTAGSAIDAAKSEDTSAVAEGTKSAQGGVRAVKPAR